MAPIAAAQNLSGEIVAMDERGSLEVKTGGQAPLTTPKAERSGAPLCEDLLWQS